MPARTRFALLLSVAVCANLLTTRNLPAKKVDKPVQGKQYPLGSQHGPWMIMVASFHEPPPEFRGEGMTPEEAAYELMFELREKRIPAYTFSQDDVVSEVDTRDRRGRERRGQYVARRKSVCVLAGNYDSPDLPIAQDTLNYIKKHFHPQILAGVKGESGFLTKLSNGGVYRKTPGRPGPLSGAFLTTNPMRSGESLGVQRHDPLLVALNSDSKYSLTDNPGKYTLVIASFYGRSKFPGSGNDEGFLSKDKFDVSDSLEVAAKNAWELTESLRNARSLGYDRDFESYIFHDRYRSIVTVGSFDSPNDPEIMKYRQLFAAKPTNKEVAANQNLLNAEVFTIPRNAAPHTALKMWIFDPYPTLIRVPKL